MNVTQGLGTSITIMNAKGGVGKSTVTLALAETLAHFHGKKVLVIDSDAQMSLSVMLMPFGQLNRLRAGWKTLVGLLHQNLILGQQPDWKDFISANVSDVDDVNNLDLMPGDLRLTLVERAVTEADRHEQMRQLARTVLAEARLAYDFILIDCPPGLSLLTEIWLREADYHLAPAKPDFLAIAGLEMFREFRKINPEMKMAENVGILINMKHDGHPEDEKYHQVLASDAESRCFPQAIPYMGPIQHAARFRSEKRSYAAKYPGVSGAAFRNVAEELMARIERHKEAMRAAAQPAASPAPTAKPAPAPAPAPGPVTNADEAAELASRFAPGKEVEAVAGIISMDMEEETEKEEPATFFAPTLPKQDK
jgi:chromosome partitioning protein